MVSIIIPNYNHAKYLRQRIDCILNQSYKDYELIILDDCSTDISVSLLKEFEFHPKLSHLIVNKRNSGSPFYQWEKGISLAKGNYIWIAESDDWCSPEFLYSAMNQLEAEKANIFFCASKFYLQKHQKFEMAPDATNDFTVKGIDLLNKGLLKENIIRNASAVVFKKELIKKFPQKIKGFKVAGDWVFWTYLCGQKDCVVTYSSNPLNFFRLHEQSAAARGEINKPTVFEGLHVILEAKKANSITKGTLVPLLAFWYEKIKNQVLQKIKEYNFNSIIGLIVTAFKINSSFGLKVSRTARFYYFKK